MSGWVYKMGLNEPAGRADEADQHSRIYCTNYSNTLEMSIKSRMCVKSMFSENCRAFDHTKRCFMFVPSINVRSIIARLDGSSKFWRAYTIRID